MTVIISRRRHTLPLLWVSGGLRIENGEQTLLNGHSPDLVVVCQSLEALKNAILQE